VKAPVPTAAPGTGPRSPVPESRSRPPAPWRALGTGAGVLGSEGLAGYLHPALGEVLAAADVIAPLAIAVALLAAILRGSSQTCERVFRLLRWIANRPEPPGPGCS
jgi:hypothetical protein